MYPQSRQRYRTSLSATFFTGFFVPGRFFGLPFPEAATAFFFFPIALLAVVTGFFAGAARDVSWRTRGFSVLFFDVAAADPAIPDTLPFVPGPCPDEFTGTDACINGGWQFPGNIYCERYIPALQW